MCFFYYDLGSGGYLLGIFFLEVGLIYFGLRELIKFLKIFLMYLKVIVDIKY